jgi:hypothetical protein
MLKWRRSFRPTIYSHFCPLSYLYQLAALSTPFFSSSNWTDLHIKLEVGSRPQHHKWGHKIGLANVGKEKEGGGIGQFSVDACWIGTIHPSIHLGGWMNEWM